MGFLVRLAALVHLIHQIESRGAGENCCFEEESFWDDLDNPVRTPGGDASHANAQLPRLCPCPLPPGTSGATVGRCTGGEANAWHLLLHFNPAASWGRGNG